VAKKRKGVNVVSNILRASIGEIKKAEKTLNRDLILQHFDFSFEVDNTTLDYLKDQTCKIQNIVSKSYTELGNVFRETQDKLANNHGGTFEKWYTNLGFAKKSVYRYIERANFIGSCQSDTTKSIVESLPVTLSYAISSPNCPAILREKVLNGEINTNKDFLIALGNLNNLVQLDSGEMELLDIDSIIEKDIKTFNENFNKVTNLYKENFSNLTKERKEKLKTEIEFLNNKLEKLLKTI